MFFFSIRCREQEIFNFEKGTNILFWENELKFENFNSLKFRYNQIISNFGKIIFGMDIESIIHPTYNYKKFYIHLSSQHLIFPSQDLQEFRKQTREREFPTKNGKKSLKFGQATSSE